MKINHFLAFQFRLNELRTKKLTDEELLAKFKDEFKYYPIKFDLKSLSVARSNYNSGHLKRGCLPPSPSFSYGPAGDILSPRGNKMNSKQIRLALLKHKERLNNAN